MLSARFVFIILSFIYPLYFSFIHMMPSHLFLPLSSSISPEQTTIILFALYIFRLSALSCCSLFMYLIVGFYIEASASTGEVTLLSCQREFIRNGTFFSATLEALISVSPCVTTLLSVRLCKYVLSIHIRLLQFLLHELVHTAVLS